MACFLRHQLIRFRGDDREGKAVGLETGTASADYIQLYHGNASLLAESLEVIQKASAVILAALEPKPGFENQEPQGARAVAS
jgi:hypothetical protein